MREILAFIILAVSLSSCYTPRYVYSPSAHNVPLLKKKGDSKFGVNYSQSLVSEKEADYVELKEKSKGVDIQGAYALTNKVALQVNYYYRKDFSESEKINSSEDKRSINYKRNLIEFAGGYYTPIGFGSQEIFQVFGGVGFGQTSFTDDPTNGFIENTRYMEFDITKIFIQPAVIYRSDKLFSFSVSSRFSYLIFSNIKTNYDSSQQAKFKLMDIHTRPGFFWEPAFIFSHGFKDLPGLRVEAQLGFSSKLGNAELDHRKSNFSIGALIDFTRLSNKRSGPAK